MRKSKLAKILYKIKIKILKAASKFHKTGAAQCTGLKLTAVDNFRKTTVVLKEQSNFTLLQKYILALV